MSKQDKYTRSARGQHCQVRIPEICTEAPENNTTVLAHLNGGGAGMKNYNIHGAYACYECHTWLDGGYVQHEVSREDRDRLHLEAVIRTQKIMIREGVLKL